MKVINEWDGAPAQTPTQPTGDHEMNSRCADCNYEDCRCDRPPMPAAGPWRTDVENAPKDEFVLLLFEGVGWNIGRAGNKCWISTSGIVFRDNAIAFATINQLETTK